MGGVILGIAWNETLMTVSARRREGGHVLMSGSLSVFLHTFGWQLFLWRKREKYEWFSLEKKLMPKNTKIL